MWVLEKIRKFDSHLMVWIALGVGTSFPRWLEARWFRWENVGSKGRDASHPSPARFIPSSSLGVFRCFVGLPILATTQVVDRLSGDLTTAQKIGVSPPPKKKRKTQQQQQQQSEQTQECPPPPQKKKKTEKKTKQAHFWGCSFWASFSPTSASSGAAARSRSIAPPGRSAKPRCRRSWASACRPGRCARRVLFFFFFFYYCAFVLARCVVFFFFLGGGGTFPQPTKGWFTFGFPSTPT